MNPLQRIWTQPRETIREIASSRPGYLFIPLAGAYGAVHSLSKVMTRGVDPAQGLTSIQILGVNLAVGSLLGIAGLYAFSFPLSWVGKLLGGVAEPRKVRTVLAWASVPFLPLLAVVIPLTLFGPSTLLVREPGSPLWAPGSAWAAPVLLYFVLWMILGVWLCVIGVVGLSEVNAFSIGRSIASYLIVVVAFLAVCFAVVLFLVSLANVKT